MLNDICFVGGKHNRRLKTSRRKGWQAGKIKSLVRNESVLENKRLPPSCWGFVFFTSFQLLRWWMWLFCLKRYLFLPSLIKSLPFPNWISTFLVCDLWNNETERKDHMKIGCVSADYFSSPRISTSEVPAAVAFRWDTIIYHQQSLVSSEPDKHRVQKTWDEG